MSTLDGAAIRAELHERLQTALELELGTLPPYITAFASLKRGRNPEPARIIHSVFMEEMLHLLLAANVLIAVGGHPRLGKEQVPTYPLTLRFRGDAFSGREFPIHLAPMTRSHIISFMRIELPAGFPDPAPDTLERSTLNVDGETIGEFYAHIQRLLRELVEAEGQAAAFCGDPDHQLGLGTYWGGSGEPIRVDGLENALAALQLIIDQGEGTDGGIDDGDDDKFNQPAEVAHFFRFKEILYGRHYAEGDSPHEPPTGTEFEVDWDGVYPLLQDPSSDMYPENTELWHLNRAFNRNYSLMLYQLQQAMNGDPRSVYTAIMNGMHKLSDLARQMMLLPVPGAPQYRGAPSWEWNNPLEEEN